MRILSVVLTLVTSCCIFQPANAAIEFIYTIKERAHVQTDDTQPDAPVEHLFGAGASGDEQLTALTLTVGTNTPVAVPGSPGEFDWEADPFLSQAALDEAYPNGPYSLSVTDGGSTQNLGPFTIDDDAYPVTPYFTNATGLNSHDLAQDYLLTWNSFTGAEEGDQILLQVWDNDPFAPEPELVFEFLDRSVTSFTIPGGTFSPDGNYDIDLLFINETDGLPEPQTIIGYLSTTTFYLSTSTSDTQLSFFKWKRFLQEGPETLTEDGYRPLATVIGGQSGTAIEYAELNAFDTGSYEFGDPLFPNFFLLTTPFGPKAELDAAYPSGDYGFFVIENGVGNNYGPYFLTGDAYPGAPRFQEFNDLQVINPAEPKLIAWDSPPSEVDLVNIRILDEADTIVWNINSVPEVNTTLLPAGTLEPNANYRLAVRFQTETSASPNPPASLGYLTSTHMPFQTADENGGDPGIDFIYTVKERAFLQESNVAPTTPIEWGFGSGVTGGSDVQGGSVTYPGGSEEFMGEPGDYGAGNEFNSQAELDSAFDNGSYTLNVTIAGSSQEFGPFSLDGDSYPEAPHILNLEELRAHDYAQTFTLNWAPFEGASEEDRIVFEVWDRTSDQDLIFEFLPADTTSYEIPGGTLVEGRQYEFDVLFVKETDGLPTPDTIIGYLSRTSFDLYTFNADTRLRFYKFQRNQQTGTETIEVDNYRPFAFVGGQSNTIAYAGIETGSQFFVNLNDLGNNNFALPLEFQTKESLDANYPAGPIRFFVNENGNDLSYGPFDLPPDAYPQAPRFQNFQELQLFDATGEQAIVWDAVPDGVTQLDVFASQGGGIVWSANALPPETTSTTIPADTLSPGSEFALIIRLWSRQVESGLLDASLGYATITIMNGQTLTPPGGNSGLISLTIFELPTGRTRLVWNDIYENETTYTVERSLAGLNSFEEIADLGPDATSFEDDPPGDAKAYFYKIRVVLPGGGN